MGGIFISYRREDGAGYAGRIFDTLTVKFGSDRVFMDVSGIEPGIDFVEAIGNAIRSSDALLAVVGNQWLNCTDTQGNRRLDDPGDPVRLEIAQALANNVRVIPVLIRGARMPETATLPRDLSRFSSRQALELSDSRWEYDVTRLVDVLHGVLNGAPKTHHQGAASSQRSTSQRPHASKPAFDAEKIVKVNSRTWKWEDRVPVGIAAAFQATNTVLKTRALTVKDVDFPTRILAKRGRMSSLSSFWNGGADIVVELEAVGHEKTLVRVSSTHDGTDLVDLFGTVRKELASIVTALLTLLAR